MVRATPNVNYVAGGLLLPVQLAGHPALEFCNTFAGWGDERAHEYLKAYEHLVVWAREHGLVDADAAARLVAEGATRAAETARVLERARALRASFYAVATADADDSAREIVAHEAELAAGRARLEWGAGAAAWTLPTTLELPLLAVARSIGTFVTSPIRVGRCPGHGCGWLFADPSGRRRWCSMAVCGNRAKARRHARRAGARRGR